MEMKRIFNIISAAMIPSKEYSDVIREALKSPRFMMEKLEENKDKMSYSQHIGLELCLEINEILYER